MADKPVTREEKYLAYLTGDYTGEIPKPITRKEKYLYELCLKGIGGEISPEEIKNAVNEYLEKNPVKPGATIEQAQQIEQNKKDIGSLKTETDSLKSDLDNVAFIGFQYLNSADGERNKYYVAYGNSKSVGDSNYVAFPIISLPAGKYYIQNLSDVFTFFDDGTSIFQLTASQGG